MKINKDRSNVFLKAAEIVDINVSNNLYVLKHHKHKKKKSNKTFLALT